MSINTFLGYRTSISLSVDIGFSAGIGVIYSEYKGNKVYSLTGFVGIGASMTMVQQNERYIDFSLSWINGLYFNCFCDVCF